MTSMSLGCTDSTDCESAECHCASLRDCSGTLQSGPTLHNFGMMGFMHACDLPSCHIFSLYTTATYLAPSPFLGPLVSACGVIYSKDCSFAPYNSVSVWGFRSQKRTHGSKTFDMNLEGGTWGNK